MVGDATKVSAWWRSVLRPQDEKKYHIVIGWVMGSAIVLISRPRSHEPTCMSDMKLVSDGL